MMSVFADNPFYKMYIVEKRPFLRKGVHWEELDTFRSLEEAEDFLIQRWDEIVEDLDKNDCGDWPTERMIGQWRKAFRIREFKG